MLIDSLWVGTTSHSANYLSFVRSYGKMIFSSRACKLLHVKLVQYRCLSFHYICWIHFAGSEHNMSKLTLDGLDVMGQCFTQEVGFLLLLWIVIDKWIPLEFKSLFTFYARVSTSRFVLLLTECFNSRSLK